MNALLLLLRGPWGKVIGGAVLLVIIAIVYSSWHHKVYADGDAAGAARVQSQWDAARDEQQKKVDAKLKEQQEKHDAIVQANVGTINDYANKLEDADARGLTLARRLRDAEAKARAASDCAVPGAGGGSTAAAPGETGGDDPITVARGAAFAECTNNADQLDALIAEIKRNQNVR